MHSAQTGLVFLFLLGYPSRVVCSLPANGATAAQEVRDRLSPVLPPLPSDAEQPIDIHIRQHLLLEQGAAILIDHEPNKAARLQLLFSRDYVPAWREQFEI